MFPISKEEAKLIRELLPNVRVVRTMKQKSKRGHYYCDETDPAIDFLRTYRESQATLSEAGGNNGTPEKR